jgi:hypothetical protein
MESEQTWPPCPGRACIDPAEFTVFEYIVSARERYVVRKLILALVCVTCGSLAVSASAATISTDASPYIDDGRVMVPMRAIFEWLGATVEYDSSTCQVVATRGDDVVRLRSGQKTASVNGSTVTMASAATSRNSRTFVPLRFVCEAMGAGVHWDASSRTVTVSSGNRTGTLKVASPESAKLKKLIDTAYANWIKWDDNSACLLVQMGRSKRLVVRINRRGSATVTRPRGRSLANASTDGIQGKWAWTFTNIADASGNPLAQGGGRLWEYSGGTWEAIAFSEGAGVPDEDVRHVPGSVIKALGVPLMSDNW